jgi:hypothetical protein
VGSSSKTRSIWAIAALVVGREVAKVAAQLGKDAGVLRFNQDGAVTEMQRDAASYLHVGHF